MNDMTVALTKTDTDTAFKMLASALRRTPLPYGDQHRYADADEFMFMYEDDFGMCFKHCLSRNYIALVDGTIQLGDGESPFQGHDFPPGLDG